jgi:hypothetical protein
MKYFGLNSDCGKLDVCKAGSILLSLILAVKNKSNPYKVYLVCQANTSIL